GERGGFFDACPQGGRAKQVASARIGPDNRSITLSVCLITADPPGRLAAILEPLRPHAHEILIAADSRVPSEHLVAYQELADRVIRIEYRQLERHLGWLFAQCSGDWIMRVDGDETPSQAFLRRLPGLLRERRIQQVWTANAWLFGEGLSTL